MSFALGWGHVLLLLIVVGAAIRFRKSVIAPWVAVFAGATVVFCWMMTADSAWIWARVPLLQIVSFPWRWLGPVAVAMAACIAGLAMIAPFAGRWKWTAFGVALALLIVPNTGHLQPRALHDVDVRFWSPYEIAQRGIEVTTFGEYRPVWMRTLPAFNPNTAGVASGKAELTETGRSPISWSGSIDAVEASTIEMAIAWFPGWTVRVDGNPVSAWPSEGTGLIRFQVPQGKHQASVTWNRTATVRVADGISMLFLVLWIVAFI
jgi:hypothetical protein